MHLRLSKPVSTSLCGLSVIVYFLWLSGGGLATGFSHDDLMNMYRAWRESLPHLLLANLCFFRFPTSYRPFGGLFYHLFFNTFGFHALPFRILLLLFLLANVYLLYVFARLLTRSRETAAIAALFGSYHVNFMPLYKNTGACYDIFCFLFYVLAFVCYIRIRQQGRLPRPLEQLGLAGLLICALNAKEMAVTLPVLIGVYEVVYHPPAGRPTASWTRWLFREGRCMCWGGLIGLAFVSGKVYATSGIGRQSGYVAAVTGLRYFHYLQHSLNEVFFTYGTSVLRDRNLGILLLLLCVVAWRSRSAAFRFSLLFWLIGILPVAFIQPRGMYATYIPLAGFAVCAALMVVRLRDLLWRRPAGARGLAQAVTFLLLMAALACWHGTHGAHAVTAADMEAARIRSIIGQLRTELPAAKKSARMLFIKDPFGDASNATWATVFITQMLYRDSTIEPDRFAMLPRAGTCRMRHYDYIFTTDGEKLILVSPANVNRSVESEPGGWTVKPVLKILLAAGLTVITSLALGLILFRALRLTFYRGEHALLAFVAGSALLSDLVFLLAANGWARKGVFYILSAAVCGVFARMPRRPAPSRQLTPLPPAWKFLSIGIVAAFSWYYLSNAMAPEVSPDGTAYHLGLVYRYARAHGLVRITTNFYASLSQGMEMLFLFAFSIGRHSAAAMVHCAFLFALPLLMIRYAQRCGKPIAGVCGALLTFAAPVAGADGVIAYNDIAAAAVAFTTFYLLHIWTEERDTRVVALAGLCAGFAYAVKYPAGIALFYGVASIAFRTGPHRPKQMARACAVFLLCATVSAGPWMTKNWLYAGNPLAPFANRIFPNPYVTVEFEEGMRAALAHSNGLRLRDLPWETTVSGNRAGGLFGCVFLLAPVALLALAKREGRQLLIAAVVFALPVLENAGSRFLIPALPFLSLAMGLALARMPVLGATVVLAHALTSWPPVVSRYCHPWAWRLNSAPWAAALRIEPEECYIAAHVGEYPVSKMLEKRVPPGSPVFSFERLAASYCDREVLVDWWGAENMRLRDTLYLPVIDNGQPMWRFAFHFAPRALYGVRVVETAAGTDIWKIAEVSLLRSGMELPVNSRWQLTAKPSPWGVRFAVDRLPITYWRSDRAIYPGMFYQIRLGGGRQAIDTVLLDCPPNQPQIRLELEGEIAPGRWQALAQAAPAASPVSPGDERRAATAELYRSGIEYILIPPGGYIKQDVEKDPSAWGLAPLDRAAGWRLYGISEPELAAASRIGSADATK